MVFSQSQSDALDDMPIDRTILTFNRLSNRLHGRKAIADLGRMPAQDLIVAMVDDPEEPAHAFLLRPELLAVGSPHLVQCRGDDRPVVRPGGTVGLRSAGGQQIIGFHHSQHSLSADSNAVPSKSGVDLLVPLGVKTGLRQGLANRLKKRLVGDQRLGSWTLFARLDPPLPIPTSLAQTGPPAN